YAACFNSMPKASNLLFSSETGPSKNRYRDVIEFRFRNSKLGIRSKTGPSASAAPWDLRKCLQVQRFAGGVEWSRSSLCSVQVTVKGVLFWVGRQFPKFGALETKQLRIPSC